MGDETEARASRLKLHSHNAGARGRVHELEGRKGGERSRITKETRGVLTRALVRGAFPTNKYTSPEAAYVSRRYS